MTYRQDVKSELIAELLFFLLVGQHLLNIPEVRYDENYIVINHIEHYFYLSCCALDSFLVW